MMYGMNMSDLSPRRWFKFSLRSLFLFVTVFGIWLGWQPHIVRERHNWIRIIRERGGNCTVYEDRYAPAITPMEMPWCRRLLGDRPMVYIMLYPDCPAEDRARVEAAFPEASIIDYSNGDFSIIPLVG